MMCTTSLPGRLMTLKIKYKLAETMCRRKGARFKFQDARFKVQGSRSKVQGARHNLVAKVWLLQHVRDQLLLLQAFDLNFRLILLLGNKFENIATVQNCPDITILNALYFGLCLFDIFSFCHFVFIFFFVILSF